MADYTQLKADITAVVFENTEQLITGEGLQQVLIEVVDKINMTKQDLINLGAGLDWNEDGELSVDFTSVQHAFAPQVPLAWNSDHLILQLGAGLIVDGSDNLTINLGFGLALDSATEELLVDTDYIQAKLTATDPLYIEPLDDSISLRITDGLVVNSDGELGVDFEDDIAGDPTVTDKAVSPKGVADYVDGILGDIQSLLEAI